MNQYQLAELLNVSQNSVSSWEAGNKFPSEENLKKIHQALGLKVDIELEKEKEHKNATLSKNGFKQRKINTHSIELIIDTAKHIYNRSNKSKISKSDLAKKIGLKPQAFSNRCVGKVPWKIAELKRLARLLNLPSYFLIFGPIDPNHAPKVSNSEIFKEYDSKGNPFYLVKEINSKINANSSIKQNEINLQERNEFQMFLKFKQFMEAQNDNE